jgi:lipoprotein-anchoring transpeptidase ErfK/SrfK
MISRRAFALSALAVGVTVLAGCSAPGSAAGHGAAGASNAVLIASPPEVTVTPADHSVDVPLDTPVTISSSAGNLTAVTVAEVGGGAVPGQLSANQRTWTATDGLDPGARYQVSVSASGAGGTHTSTAASFTTLNSVAGRLITDATPGDGATVGVGEPIDLHFSNPIAQSQQAEIVKHLHVVSTPPQDGAWHWFSPAEIHYRPAQYWLKGTKVTLSANFHGVNAGNGIWGLAGWSQSFTVGDKHVSLIDDTTHQMQVFTNDVLQYTWPVSLGKPGFPTLEGTLVVLTKVQKVLMSSCSTFGGAACVPGAANFYNQYVYWDTAVSSNGFFIHAAPWSVASQGYADVSHGCINLSTDRAITFFNYSLIGDVVVISHTGNIADMTNGEEDWQIPFAQWDNTGVAPDTAPTSAPGGQ